MLLAFAYIVGIVATLSMGLCMEDDGDIPDFGYVLFICLNWPIYWIYNSASWIYNHHILFEPIPFTRWFTKKPKNDSILPLQFKDHYLMDAEREVEAFLGYKDVPEEKIATEFEEIEARALMAKNEQCSIKMIRSYDYENNEYFNEYIKNIKDLEYEKFLKKGHVFEKGA